MPRLATVTSGAKKQAIAIVVLLISDSGEFFFDALCTLDSNHPYRAVAEPCPA
jgi:hypothetical protein